MTWRARATPIIRDVLARTAGQPEKAIKRALVDAYPFGPREHHPYKIWLDEIRRQRGKRPNRGPCGCSHGTGSHRGRIGPCLADDCDCRKYEPGNPDQAELFGGAVG